MEKAELIVRLAEFAEDIHILIKELEKDEKSLIQYEQWLGDIAYGLVRLSDKIEEEG